MKSSVNISILKELEDECIEKLSTTRDDPNDKIAVCVELIQYGVLLDAITIGDADGYEKQLSNINISRQNINVIIGKVIAKLRVRIYNVFQQTSQSSNTEDKKTTTASATTDTTRKYIDATHVSYNFDNFVPDSNDKKKYSTIDELFNTLHDMLNVESAQNICYVTNCLICLGLLSFAELELFTCSSLKLKIQRFINSAKEGKLSDYTNRVFENSYFRQVYLGGK